jgi:hypothetical protein
MQNALDDLPPSRFWDETVRVPGLFDEAYRSIGRQYNAIACFDRMARTRYWEMQQRGDFDRSKKSIVTMFQPKSGGTYLHNRMLQLGYSDFAWCFPHLLCHSLCIAGPDALQLFMAGGCTCHTHARPDPNILAALDRAGVEKIWVHLRNPAESAISSYYHYLGQGQGAGAVGEQRRQDALADASRQGMSTGMDVSTFAVEKVSWFIEWVRQWLHYANNHPELVVFSFHHELANPQAMFTRVFSELGVEWQGEIAAAPTCNDRYRAKRSGPWGMDVTPEARRFLVNRVRVDLEQYPQYDVLRVESPGSWLPRLAW